MLYPAEEASGKLATLVRNQAKDVAREGGKKLIIIDGSPGIGCPVIASIGGVDLALVVTEPTLSAVHDLKRILAVTKHFKVDAAVIVNKYDINCENTDEIMSLCESEKVPVLGRIRYDPDITRAQVAGKSIVEYSEGETSKTIKEIWDAVNDRLRQ